MKINNNFHSLNNVRCSDFSDLNSAKPEEFAFLNGEAGEQRSGLEDYTIHDQDGERPLK